MSSALKLRVLSLYKTLLFMGRDYPQGYKYFRDRCNTVFKKNKGVKDPKEIEKMITHGEFVVKELEALYYLRKYRTLKRRYYADENEMTKFRNLSNMIAKYERPDSDST
ncbi:LYR motif-containing protein 5 [Orchesella cincta]|uniref:LYR motif-containing protein 5 n=1 Tax=Orchesella cincta TaxID=48709 RepID=A0A1D2N0C8_ORCCI|nr:LYR motif-containing protein 5 [Orchesella cincta]